MAQRKRAAKPKLEYTKTYDINYNAVEKDREDSARISAGSVDWWKAKEGDNLIRVLPPHPSLDRPYYRVYLHYNLAEFPVACPGRDVCPICKYLATQERGHTLKGTLRIYLNILDRKDAEPKVHIFPIGNKIFKEFLDVFMDVDEWGDVVDPIKGTDMIVRRTGTGLDTEYSTRFRRKSSPIATTQEEFDEIIDGINDLSTLSEELSVEKLETMLETWIEDNEKGSGSDNYERLKKAEKDLKKKKGKGKPSPENLDEEEEEEEEDAEDDPDDDLDIDEDDPDDEDDPEEDDPDEPGDNVEDILDDLLGDAEDPEEDEDEPPPKKKSRGKPKAKR